MSNTDKGNNTLRYHTLASLAMCTVILALKFCNELL